jgi:hypothetical protein
MIDLLFFIERISGIKGTLSGYSISKIHETHSMKGGKLS